MTSFLAAKIQNKKKIQKFFQRKMMLVKKYGNNIEVDPYI